MKQLLNYPNRLACLLSLLALSASASLFAQPVINSQDLYTPGRAVLRSHGMVMADPVSEGDSGANRTYDFSGLVPESTDTLYFRPPAQRRWGTQLRGNLLAVKSTDTLSQGWYGVGPLGLFSHGANVINSQGQYSDVVEQPPMRLMPAVARYGEGYRDTSVARVMFFVGQPLQTPYVVDSVRRRTTSLQQARFDGYGTLTIPGGRSYPALRQTVIFFVQDRADFKNRTTGQWVLDAEVMDYERREVRFWTPTFPYPIVTLLDNSNSGFIDGYTYMRGALGPVANAPALTPGEFSLYPNPTAGLAHLKAPAGSQFTITDALGKPVLSGYVGQSAQTLDVRSLPAGLYLVRAKAGIQEKTFRLVKAR